MYQGDITHEKHIYIDLNLCLAIGYELQVRY